MDYQRKIFYSRRREILAGKGLKEIIENMIESAIEKNCRILLDGKYHLVCVVEWAKTTFGVDVKLSDINNLKADEIEELIKKLAGSSVSNEISLSLGEYLEDYSDPSTWDIQGLCKWAMSTFRVSLSPGKIRHQSPEEIEEQLVEAAAEQVNKKDCSQLAEFLRDDFSQRTFTDWARAKFGIKLDPAELKDMNEQQVRQKLLEQTATLYKQREVEYPVEFAMNMVYGQEGANVYAFETLANWANKKYDADFSVEILQNESPAAIHKKLLELSKSFNNGQLEQIIESRLPWETKELAKWANERFEGAFTEDQFGVDMEERRELLTETAKEFMRSELSNLERYVLLQIYDSTWKDHLYTMDHLKNSIWTRSFAEKDPKVEYKREGFRLFSDMLESTEDRVTDIIFKVRLEAGARARNVWNVSQTAHDEVGQFEMAR
jgi:preprotein translocase subunit SecA